jgi:phospholipid/cholesterol/gamma-HCH transport system substrate-binding protein
VSRKANPTLIGAFVLGGALLAVIAVVAFGSGRLFRDTETFISFFDGSVAGLNVGAAVRFRGIDVGVVQDILLDFPSTQREGNDLRIAVVYDIDRKRIESRGAGVRLEDPLDITALLTLGIRAELATESLVTGMKYIALDLDPEHPVSLEPVPGLPYPEIPTVSTGLERIEDEVYRIIADLGAVRLDTLVTVATAAFSQINDLAGSADLSATVERLPATIDRLNSTLSDLQRVLARVDAVVAPLGDDVRRTTEQATATMAQLQGTLADMDAVLDTVGSTLDPRSPLFIQFERAMTDLSGASRALRDLADYLERNPSALLRGRPEGNE